MLQLIGARKLRVDNSSKTTFVLPDSYHAGAAPRMKDNVPLFDVVWSQTSMYGLNQNMIDAVVDRICRNQAVRLFVDLQ